MPASRPCASRERAPAHCTRRYRARRPEHTPLYQVVQHHFESWLALKRTSRRCNAGTIAAKGESDSASPFLSLLEEREKRDPGSVKEIYGELSGVIAVLLIKSILMRA